MNHTKELIERAHRGDEKARETLVLENMGLIGSIVRRFAGRGYEQEDLFQIGSIGLIMGRYKKLQENGSISIAGANDSIQRIILISGLHKLVHTCKDVSQAAKNIEK